MHYLYLHLNLSTSSHIVLRLHIRHFLPLIKFQQLCGCFRFNLATLACLEIMLPKMIQVQITMYFLWTCFLLLEFSQKMHAAEFGVKYVLIPCLWICHSQVDSEAFFESPGRNLKNYLVSASLKVRKMRLRKASGLVQGHTAGQNPCLSNVMSILQVNK